MGSLYPACLAIPAPKCLSDGGFTRLDSCFVIQSLSFYEKSIAAFAIPSPIQV
ncbi:hypothetical protein NIES2104_09860 [Leptolyngbya sp. NIES-2104]|nr:hypothetical protein NIES2104_09860 [Leptolyngbya sp. NIES-2104]